MDYQDLTKMTANELATMRRKLAKRANQRMVRLERSKSEVTGKAYHVGAYDIAQDYLRQIDRPGKRFSESINYAKSDGQYNIYRLKKEILELDTFLHSKTSTITGNRIAEQKRIDTFTGEKWGLSEETVTSKGFYDFLHQEAYEYFLKNSFTSEQMIEVFDTFREQGASEYKIRQGISKYKIAIKKVNANSTNGQAKTASIKEMVDYINEAAGTKVKATDVLNIKG